VSIAEIGARSSGPNGHAERWAARATRSVRDLRDTALPAAASCDVGRINRFFARARAKSANPAKPGTVQRSVFLKSGSIRRKCSSSICTLSRCACVTAIASSQHFARASSSITQPSHHSNI
jgi:hypothetical protein